MPDVKPDPESAGAAATDAADAAADGRAAKRVKREQQQQDAAQAEAEQQHDGVSKQEENQQHQQQVDEDEDDELIPMPLSTTRSAVKRGHECPYLDTILRQVSSRFSAFLVEAASVTVVACSADISYARSAAVASNPSSVSACTVEKASVVVVA
jgi:hypothetical protein